MTEEEKDLLLAELIALTHHFTVLGFRTGDGPVYNTGLKDFKNEEVMEPLGGLVPPLSKLPENIQELVKDIRDWKYNIR